MSKELLDNIKAAGVVGAGGAGFPTHIKLAAKAETLIVNAAECEPLIRVDQQLLQTHAEEFFKGLDIALQLSGASQAKIAIKAKHAEIIKELKVRAANSKNIEIFEMGDFYPAGDEQVLVYDVLGKVVPRGGIPLAVGTVVSNVETLINVARAVNSLPVTTTFVTVAGDLPKPATYELPIGISYREALALAGATDLDGKSALDGGPMMGKLISDLDAPITKTTKAVLLFDNNNRVITESLMSEGMVLKQSRTACEQCQKCTDLCPRDLLGHDVKPHLTMRIANYGISDFQGMTRSLGCSECGACELYSCPCGLSPRRVNQLVKQQLAKAGVKVDNSGLDFKALPMFAYRKIPVKRLIARLGLRDYDRPAPLSTLQYQPKQVTMLLKQHLGAPATAVVSMGDAVNKGDLIAKIDDDKLGANIHASITGQVTAANDAAIVLTKN
ncbi:MAG: SLBB domain-containing protein [Coriobacteriales bacterium]|jgi:Na+-translocating ferredoxin:NAD+ oxidoreductase RnfC subunit|nr:SLBB domain-containing protein [Coriobacteriales bacterium]